VLGKNRWRSFGLYPQSKVVRICLTIGLVALFVLTPCLAQSEAAGFWNRSRRIEPRLPVNIIGGVSEAAPPPLLQELRQLLDRYQPQVAIISPRAGQVLSDTSVTVKFRVVDLPVFKNADFGLGPHLHVLLDNQPYQAVYNLNEPLIFENLRPGTHTIRAFASRPWHESFKNEGAFAQTTFHIFTKTQENAPEPGLPLLTYSRPQGTYGAEPILLDYYLSNAPLHLVARADDRDEVADWRIRATVNGQSFTLDRWQPIYLKGFKPGKNWVQLEYLDGQGNPIQNPFNNTARLLTYEPGGTDSLSRIVRGELTLTEVRGIVDPTYVPPAPEVIPLPEPAPPLLPAEPNSELTPETAPPVEETPRGTQADETLKLQEDLEPDQMLEEFPVAPDVPTDGLMVEPSPASSPTPVEQESPEASLELAPAEAESTSASEELSAPAAPQTIEEAVEQALETIEPSDKPLTPAPDQSLTPAVPEEIAPEAEAPEPTSQSVPPAIPLSPERSDQSSASSGQEPGSSGTDELKQVLKRIQQSLSPDASDKPSIVPDLDSSTPSPQTAPSIPPSNPDPTSPVLPTRPEPVTSL
jgi:hypothetical protein